MLKPALRKDTKQAVNQVVEALIATGHFEIAYLPCPDSGRRCKALRLPSTVYDLQLVTTAELPRRRHAALARMAEPGRASVTYGLAEKKGIYNEKVLGKRRNGGG